MTASSPPQGCPICKHQAATPRWHRLKEGVDVDCWRCGSLEISREAWVNFRDARYDDERWKVSAWVRQFKPEILTGDILEQARASTAPTLTVRARRLLEAFGHDFPQGHQGRLQEPQDFRYMAIGWCRNIQELEFMLRDLMASELGWLRSFQSLSLPFVQYALTPKGALELESASSTDSAIAFCAMWFDKEVLSLYTEVIEQAARACGYEPLRLDRKEHNNRVDDEIIANLRGARFVIADMTGHRGGVYYEAGFAHGLGLPVIFMLREGSESDVHFDVRQQNFILWRPDDLGAARTQLQNRIRATLGQGPLKPSRP